MLHVLQHNDNSVSSLKPTRLWILAARSPQQSLSFLSPGSPYSLKIFQEIKDMASITILCQTKFGTLIKSVHLFLISVGTVIKNVHLC